MEYYKIEDISVKKLLEAANHNMRLADRMFAIASGGFLGPVGTYMKINDMSKERLDLLKLEAILSMGS